MDLNQITFNRRFSVNFYRNLSIPMSEMSFNKDWTRITNGDPYPVLMCEGNVQEQIGEGRYTVCSSTGGEICRLLGSFFSYSTYDIKINAILNAAVGLKVFNDDGFSLCITADNNGIHIIEAKKQTDFANVVSDTLSVTFRSGGVSIYSCHDGFDELVVDMDVEGVSKLTTAKAFRATRVGLYCAAHQNGKAVVERVCSRISAGISQADIKPVKYENGEVMMQNGRVFLSATARQQIGGYQIIMSWCPTTADFKLESVLFFDCGDGRWSADVALSLVFDRNTNKWLYWMCAFSHGHVLARGCTEQDPRFGVNLLKVELTENQGETSPADRLYAVTGDEDPDLIFYDGKWHLAVCRVEPDDGYHYYRYESDEPLDGFSYCDRTLTGGKTGGMFAKLADKLYFICGTDFNSRAKYEAYKWNDFSDCSLLKADYDDGGFRGWGSVMCLPQGSEQRLIWITFDRHKASDWNWSYGNIYVFDAEEK